MPSAEFKYDDRTEIEIKYHTEDESFTHAFGHKLSWTYVIDEIKVYIYADFCDWINITDKLNKRTITYLKDWCADELTNN